MPAKSKAQAGKLAVLYKQGKVSKQTLDEYLKGVKVSKLPKHAKKTKRGGK